jgi:hypothetical protein
VLLHVNSIGRLANSGQRSAYRRCDRHRLVLRRGNPLGNRHPRRRCRHPDHVQPVTGKPHNLRDLPRQPGLRLIDRQLEGTQVVNHVDTTTSVASSANRTVTLSGDTATITTSALALGQHAITATYSGDVDHNPSSGAVTQVVNNAGYWVAGQGGALYAFGEPSFGSAAATPLNCPIVAMAPTPTGVATGSWQPTAACSVSATPRSTDPSLASASSCRTSERSPRRYSLLSGDACRQQSADGPTSTLPVGQSSVLRIVAAPRLPHSACRPS